MSKILSKSGDSLADVYDVEGSIAGIDELLSKDVNLVHEMGATILSERLSGTIFSFNTGAILQNITFNVNFTLGRFPIRLLGVQIISSNSGRVTNASVHITDLPPSINDMPILAWEAATDSEITMQVAIAGTVNPVIMLRSIAQPSVPNLLLGTDTPGPTPVISLRGISGGFGAGNVTVTCILYFAEAVLRGVSSRGLPLPGW